MEALGLGCSQPFCADQVVVGVVYNPVMRELFTAVAGRGARLNGAPIRVSSARELGAALLVTEVGVARDDETVVAIFGRVGALTKQARPSGDICLGCLCMHAHLVFKAVACVPCYGGYWHSMQQFLSPESACPTLRESSESPWLLYIGNLKSIVRRGADARRACAGLLCTGPVQRRLRACGRNV